MGLAVNREASNPKLEARGNLGQRRVGAVATGEAVGDNAYMMSAVGLTVGEIEDVADDSSNRRTHGVQDT